MPGPLLVGQFSKGSQKKQYKGVLKVDCKCAGVIANDWEEQATNCSV